MGYSDDINTLQLDKRVIKLLTFAGINKSSKLMTLPEKELKEIPGMTTEYIINIKEALIHYCHELEKCPVKDVKVISQQYAQYYVQDVIRPY